MKTLLMCAFLCACAPAAGSYSRVKLPDTTDGAVVKCSSKVDCFQRSTEACSGFAYNVLQDEEGKPVNDFRFQEQGYGLYVIRCFPVKEEKPQ